MPQVCAHVRPTPASVDMLYEMHHHFRSVSPVSMHGPGLDGIPESHLYRGRRLVHVLVTALALGLLRDGACSLSGSGSLSQLHSLLACF